MADKEIDIQNKVQLFNDKKIRSVWDSEEEQWYFSVIDVIAVLTDSVNPRDYWFKMKKRVHSEDGIELSTICRQLKMKSSDGKFYNTDAVNLGWGKLMNNLPTLRYPSLLGRGKGVKL
ncbi:MAG: hypothetical protein ILP07_05795 [Treponema sp.]|nr:hypothetical protein [Treponema sp.]